MGASFDRRLVERVAAAGRTLAVCVAAGLVAALLLLAQMTLLAAVIAGAAEGRLDQLPAAVAVALVVIVAARSGLAHAVELSGRRTATRVMSALRAELVSRRLRPGAGQRGHGESAQLAGIREVTDRYRRTTMGTLRLSFLSGVVLDLAATWERAPPGACSGACCSAACSSSRSWGWRSAPGSGP